MYNNIKKITLSGLVACLVVGLSAFTGKDAKVVGTYYYNQPVQQTWSPSNALPADQISTHYSEFTGSPDCQPSSNICTYELVSGKYVQSSQGTFN